MAADVAVVSALGRTPAEAGHRLEDGGATISATLATDCSDKPRLYVGQPEITGPAITGDRNRMAAAIVGAIDHQATHTLGAHVGEGDSLRTDRRGHGL